MHKFFLLPEPLLALSKTPIITAHLVADITCPNTDDDVIADRRRVALSLTTDDDRTITGDGDCIAIRQVPLL